jgi:hypothetical protein
MSDYAVKEFFREESMLSIHLGQDGMLGFFASNYPTIISMARTIIEFRNDAIQEIQDTQEALKDARDNLSFLDELINTHKTLSVPDQSKYNSLKKEIKHYKAELKRQRPIFFRGEVITAADPEFEFIRKVDYTFPGLLESLCELDRLIRIPIGNTLGNIMRCGITPLRFMIKMIVDKCNLGLAGSFMLMLVDQYPELMSERIYAEEASEQPEDYSDHDINGYGVKEIKEELIEKEFPQEV